MSGVVPLLLALMRPLLLTIGIELALGMALLRERTGYAALVLALAQVATNPLVQLACMWSGWSLAAPLASLPWAALGAAELAAVAVEALLFCVAAITRHPWRLSAALNATSFAAGLLLGTAGLL